MSIALLPKDLAYCSPVHLEKAWQVDGSTALTGWNIYPVLVPAPGALSIHFLRTKKYTSWELYSSLRMEEFS